VTARLAIPGVETVHPREAVATACYPILGPPLDISRVWTPLLHYTAAVELPDGDLGEHDYQVGPYLQAVNRDYWDNRVGTGIYTCASRKPGYAVGYSFAVDWLGGVWELRGFDILPAATANNNTYTLPVLFLTDAADGASDLALASARAVWREARRRSGNALFLNRPRGHREVCGGCTACPGDPLMAQRDAGLMDLDYQPPQEEPPMATLAAPIRVLDTRDKGRQPLDPMQPRRVGVLPQPPAWAGAVRANLTVTQPDAGGWLSIDGGATSKVNYPAGGTVANEVSIPLRNDGAWYLELTSSQRAHVVVDVCGFDSLI
jgi:hypothetical protein